MSPVVVETGITPLIRERLARLRRREALAELIAATLPELAPARPEEPRVWPKPGGRFVLVTRLAGRETPPWVAVHLYPEEARLPVVAPGCGAVLAGERIVVQAFPDDFRLKSLKPALTELPSLLRRPDLGVARPAGYRPGKRAVLEVTSGGERIFVKIYREAQTAAQVASAHAALAGVAGLTVAAIERVSLAPAFVATRALEGGLLASREHRDVPEDLAAAGAALARLHDHPFVPARRFGPEDELATLAGWTSVAGALDAELAEELAPVTRRLPALAPESAPPALVHRDFYDKQVLVSGGDVALVDLDTLALGDGALDLANFEAHLLLRELDRGGSGSGSSAAVAAFRDGYRRGRDLPPPGRLGFYRATTLCRLAAVYSLRPGRPGLPLLLAQAAERAAEGGEP